MPSHQEHPGQYQQDKGTSGRSGAPKRLRRSDQRHHPGARSHYREAEDQAQLRHVLHRLVDSSLPFCRKFLSGAQGVPRGDARSRVVGAKEHSEDPDSPAAYSYCPPIQSLGKQVDGQGYEPDEGDLDHVEPHEPPPLLYSIGDAARLRMEDLPKGEGKRRTQQDETAQERVISGRYVIEDYSSRIVD